MTNKQLHEQDLYALIGLANEHWAVNDKIKLGKLQGPSKLSTQGYMSQNCSPAEWGLFDVYTLAGFSTG